MNKKAFYQKVISELNTGVTDLSKLRAEYNKLRSDKESGIWTPEYIKTTVNPMLESLKFDIDKRTREVERVLDTIYKEHAGILHSEDALRPEELTDDTKLLNAGIKLSKRDLQDIIDRNANNRTMIQLTLRHAEQNGVQGLSTRNYVSAESHVRELDTVIHAAKTALKWSDKPDSYKHIYDKLLGEGSTIAAWANE